MVTLELEARLDNLLSTGQKETANIDLFALIEERDECPICLIPLPFHENDIVFKSCCGKTICDGCAYKHMLTDVNKKGLSSWTHENFKCAFCQQSPTTFVQQRIKALKKLMKKNNSGAFNEMAGEYQSGKHVFQSDTRALEMRIRAAELGNAQAYVLIGHHYEEGTVVERDQSKSIDFLKVAAKKGSVFAHDLLASYNELNENVDECIQHLVVAASAGYQPAMDELMYKYKQKMVSKDNLAETLRAYQASNNEMKSKDRDDASAILRDYDREVRGNRNAR